LELRRIKAETESKQIKAETKNKRIELQNEREKREHELRVAEAGRPAERGEQNGYVDQNMEEDGGERGAHKWNPGVDGWRLLADRVKRYGSALKQVVSPVPSDATEIPQFFESLEAMFCSFKIPADSRAKLLSPFLTFHPKMNSTNGTLTENCVERDKTRCN